MTVEILRYGKAVFAAGLLLAASGAGISTAEAAAQDYRFELAGQPTLVSDKAAIVRVRLVHVADGKPVPDAVIFESTADMGPSGMASMTAPVKVLPAKDGVYSFEVDPGALGPWALHLAAKVQGEPEDVRGTVTAELATTKKPGGR